MLTTRPIEKIETIDPDAHAHLLLGFLGVPIKNLSPKGATEILHIEIFCLFDGQLEILTDVTISHFAKVGKIDDEHFDSAYGDLLTKLKLIRDRWLPEQIRRAK